MNKLLTKLDALPEALAFPAVAVIAFLVLYTLHILGKV